MTETPGRRTRAPWAALTLGEWKRHVTLKQGDSAALLRTAHAGQVWAGRNGLRLEYRVRDKGRVLWVRLVTKDTPPWHDVNRMNDPDEPEAQR